MAFVPPAPPVRVFIDSTVLFAAALSPTGGAREVLLRGIRHQLVLCLSSLVLEETERNLHKKASAAVPVFALLREALALSPVDPPVTLVRKVSEIVEPKDAPIVAGALHCQAHFLATHDRRHLVSQRAQIKAAFGLAVVTPGELLQGAKP